MSKWISVNDRLPDSGSISPLLICCEGIVGFAWYSYRAGAWISSSGVKLDEKVTHWMPLPEPPKEEKWK